MLLSEIKEMKGFEFFMPVGEGGTRHIQLKCCFSYTCLRKSVKFRRIKFQTALASLFTFSYKTNCPNLY